MAVTRTAYHILHDIVAILAFAKLGGDLHKPPQHPLPVFFLTVLEVLLDDSAAKGVEAQFMQLSGSWVTC